MDKTALLTFFETHPHCALAFSGGTDSAFLFAFAVRHGFPIQAYYMRTAFQPEFEYQDACRIAQQLGAPLHVVELDVLQNSEVTQNPQNRCYFCKKTLFSNLCKEAELHGNFPVIDGTNASDDAADRPGMRALHELGVLSPLRLCGYTKQDVRRESEQLGLFTAHKPSYACLATRIPTGMPIVAEDLRRVELAEKAVHALGFRDFRLRVREGGRALMQVTEAQRPLALERWTNICAVTALYFSAVTLDSVPRRAAD